MIITKQIEIKTRGHTDIIDITSLAEQKLAETDLSTGTLTVFVIGSTAGITTIEYEPGLVKDLKNAFERIAPLKSNYEHNLRWGDGNGYAHIRASLLKASLTIPFTDKRLILGTWQQIVFVDFDNRPRQRKIALQFMGE